MSIAEGLSSNSVYTIFQDSHGALWFGTLDGLDRYDGYAINVFKHDKLKKRSLSNNRITQMYEDRNHQLWLYDEFTSTMIRYNPDKDEFRPYYLDKVVGANVRDLDSIYEKKDGTLYLHSIEGYNLHYNENEDAFEAGVRDPVGDQNWLNKNSWATLLAAFDEFLQNTKSPFTVRSILIRKIVKDSEGRYWIPTKYDGLYSAIEDAEGFVFTSHLHTTDKFKYIGSEEIYDVFEDRSNVVWIGTKNAGLYRYTRYKYKFGQIGDVEVGNNVLPIGTVRAITQDANKNIWIGTNDQGLIRIEQSGKKGKLYKPDPNQSNSVGHRYIRSLWVDDNQTLWVGHYQGFSRYQPDTDDFIRYYPKNKNSNEEIRIYDFKKGKGNTLWLAGWDVILHADIEKNEYEFISRTESKSLGFKSENIRDLELDDERYLWMAVGERGMSLYHNEVSQFTTLQYSPSDTLGLPSDNIFDIFKDSKGNIWLATADGLCHFDPTTEHCETYTTNEGLPSNLVYGILEDNRGKLWFSTTKGIGEFDRAQKKFRNYDVSDGLQSNEFTENAFYQNNEGVIFFGGINGINFFHPDRVPNNPIAPQVAITTIKIFEKPLTEVAIFSQTDINKKFFANEALTLTPEQRSISFEFVAFHYVNPQKNKYAYMLERFDTEWTYQDANVRFANYTNLEPGTYIFKVKASNSDGLWSDPIQLKITIEDPFYTTTWFISTTLILGLALGIGGYRWRIATVKKQQSMKSIQLESELNFLKSQVNPHFLFNTLNNIYALCQVNSRNAAPMVGKISEMMRYMIYDCTAQQVPVQKELDYLKNYIDLNQLKSSRRLNASIIVEGNPDGLKIAPLLLINFLENSFKHGDLSLNGEGFIHVHLVITGFHLSFIVKNSFREKPFGNQGQAGIGLKNVKHRLSLLYPGKHTLRIEKNSGIFEINLKLDLD